MKTLHHLAEYDTYTTPTAMVGTACRSGKEPHGLLKPCDANMALSKVTSLLKSLA